MFAYPALLILLLAGYFPALAVTSLRYRHSAVNGWRLLLESLILGIVFAFFGALLSGVWPGLRAFGAEIALELIPYSDSVARDKGVLLPAGIVLALPVSVAISLIIATIERLWYGDGSYALGGQRISARVAGPLHETLLDAMRQEALVMISMKWGKVYVGFVARLPEPAAAIECRGSVRFLPFLGGYRDKDTKKVVLGDDYSKAIKAWRQSQLAAQLPAGHPAREEQSRRGHEFTVDFRYEDVESVRRFDGGLFKEFEKLRVEPDAVSLPAAPAAMT